MLFNSASFLIFFPMVVALYFATPPRFRWLLLLLASYYFYMCWRPEYVALLMLSTLIDYVAGIEMGKREQRSARLPFLLLSILSNLGLLFAFKYAKFFSESARAVFRTFNLFYEIPTFELLLPVGISFYTFQTLSYSIDVYRGHMQPERHLGVFALYVTFFPQLVAGPIERSTTLLPQFYHAHEFSAQRVAEGLQLMLWGFFKKVVIADRLAVYVNAVYNHPGDYQGAPLVLATYFFAVQIYCDFSGYSDIAIGAAKVLGYDLMDNFKRPYFATSIREFWQRWHISLSTWFRDYLYVPLGGNRVSRVRWSVNLFSVFVISGLWHGANWTFVVWGALHGLYLVASLMTKPARDQLSAYVYAQQCSGVNTSGFGHPRMAHRMHHYLKIVMTFHLVLFAWIFFRARTLSDAFLMIHNMLQIDWATLHLAVPRFGNIDLCIALLSILLLEMVHGIEEHQNRRRFLDAKQAWLRWLVCSAAMLFIVFFGKFEGQDFIYFQF